MLTCNKCGSTEIKPGPGDHLFQYTKGQTIFLAFLIPIVCSSATVFAIWIFSR